MSAAVTGEEAAERRFERWDTAYSPRVPRGEAFGRRRRTPLMLEYGIIRGGWADGAGTEKKSMQ